MVRLPARQSSGPGRKTRIISNNHEHARWKSCPHPSRLFIFEDFVQRTRRKAIAASVVVCRTLRTVWVKESASTHSAISTCTAHRWIRECTRGCRNGSEGSVGSRAMIDDLIISGLSFPRPGTLTRGGLDSMRKYGTCFGKVFSRVLQFVHAKVLDTKIDLAR
jgi:hypothetical protein